MGPDSGFLRGGSQVKAQVLQDAGGDDVSTLGQLDVTDVERLAYPMWKMMMVFEAGMAGWDERRDGVTVGPPGSIRTGPPEALSALPADDGEGPSYRRLPDNVGCSIPKFSVLDLFVLML